MGKKSLKKTDDKKCGDATQLEEYNQQKKVKELFFLAWPKPNPIASVSGGVDNLGRILDGLNLVLAEGGLQDPVVDKIMGEIVTRAYQDGIIAYTAVPTEKTLGGMQQIQRIRQSADLHLTRIIQAFMDMKRPPVSVVVKRTDQVNVADKQINISQKKNSPSDLDKKNEKTG